MGNETSKITNRMAISAVAQMMKITKDELLALRDKCLSLSDTYVRTSSGFRLTRLNFMNAMRQMKVTSEPDFEILEKLFVMWDCEGVDWVEPLEFFAGLAPLASVMNVATKLHFAIKVYDHKNSGRLSRDDLMTVLSAINTTSSYLGDAVLRKSQIQQIVDDLFDDDYEIENDDDKITITTGTVFKITCHPLVFAFTAGAGTARYGSAQ